MLNTSASVSTGMETGSFKKVIILLVGILAAFFIANTLTTVALSLSGVKGAAGMVVSFIVYAVIFFAVLQLLQNYAHFVFFGFDRE